MREHNSLGLPVVPEVYMIVAMSSSTIVDLMASIYCLPGFSICSIHPKTIGCHFNLSKVTMPFNPSNLAIKVIPSDKWCHFQQIQILCQNPEDKLVIFFGNCRVHRRDDTYLLRSHIHKIPFRSVSLWWWQSYRPSQFLHRGNNRLTLSALSCKSL